MRRSTWNTFSIWAKCSLFDNCSVSHPSIYTVDNLTFYQASCGDDRMPLCASFNFLLKTTKVWLLWKELTLDCITTCEKNTMEEYQSPPWFSNNLYFYNPNGHDSDGGGGGKMLFICGLTASRVFRIKETSQKMMIISCDSTGNNNRQEAHPSFM